MVKFEFQDKYVFGPGNGKDAEIDTFKLCGQGHIMREVKTSSGSYWICDNCGEMKN